MKKDSLRIITNFSCNQRCLFCYQTKWDNNFITISDIRKILTKNNISFDTLKDHFNNISIMGGEAFLHKSMICLVYLLRLYFKKQINIDTNGKILLSISPEKYKDHLYYLLIDTIDRLSIDFGYPQTISNEKEIGLIKDKIKLMERLLKIHPRLTLKCNHVFSEKNEKDIFDIFNKFLIELSPLYEKYKDRILITICEDVIKTKSHITLNDFIKKFNAKYIRFIDEAKIHILEINSYQLGYFGLDDFEDTDLIIWKDGYTDSFTKYLTIVNPNLITMGVK